MRHWLADKMVRSGNWLGGNGLDYDEFDHGYSEGLKKASKFKSALEAIRSTTTPSLDPKIWSMANHALEGKSKNRTE